MNEEDIRRIAKEVYAEEHRSNPFKVTPIPFHMHNGVDSPRLLPVNFLGFPIRTLTPTDTPANGTIVLSDIGGLNLLLTAGPAMGATSATLVNQWSYPNDVRIVNFSNSDQRSVTFTSGSASITWASGLSSSATTNISTVETRRLWALINNVWYGVNLT